LSICRGLPIIVLLLASFTSLAQPPDPGQGVFLAIVIDDLGNSRLEGERVAALPGPAAADPGPGALMTGQSRATLQSLLHAGIDHLPGVIGVNNHMGSYLTRHAAYMDWLMEDLSQMHGTLFVDSMTTPHSKALGIARAYGVATTRRDLFIDNDPSPEGVRAQWRLLLESALREGSALAIGHPRDATLDLLETELEGLEARGIILTSVTDLIRFRQRETTRWQEFSSR
jgi:polysaccharide deacetylase 2 family uncharacterized protein YibQ